MTTRVRELDRGRLLLDLHFRGEEQLVAAYLIPGADGWTVVETGPTTCLEALLAGLSEGGIEPNDVARVLVTHIHLDHAGGLGAVAERLPRARLGAHASALRHLLDPSRLIESARRAWGAAADPLWGAVLPVPGDRLDSLSGGERFAVDGGELEVLATPGHARHHLSFFDAPRRAMITGDSAGVFLPGSGKARPAIPPPDLDLALLFESLRAMAEREPTELDYTHFGPVAGGGPLLAEYRKTVERWSTIALEAAKADPSVPHVAAALRAAEQELATQLGERPSVQGRQDLVSGSELAAQGLLRYFATRGELPPGER
jgi:glyoxylase-like metal-dependent hydrolase (beta-lactamase superfamily II)